jgi:hypothetical protein
MTASMMKQDFSRTQIDSALPQRSAPPAGHSLRAALEELSATAKDGIQLSTALVEFQRNLIAAEHSRLIGVTSTGCFGVDSQESISQPETDLCVRAIKTGTTVAEQSPSGVHIATPIGLAIPGQDGKAAFLVAFFTLPKATPLALAMAQERLELSAAIARALVQNKPTADAAKSINTDVALEFASAQNVQDGLNAAAAKLLTYMPTADILMAAVRRGKIHTVVHTSHKIIPADLKQKYNLALCEVIDFGGTIRCGGASDAPAPGGIAAIFATSRVIGHAKLSDIGDGIVALVAGPDISTSLSNDIDMLAVPVMARMRTLGVYPKVEQTLAKIPALARMTPERRLPTARRWAFGALILLCIMPVPDTVSGTVTIEPQTRRIVSAPIMSRIDKVHVQPGDIVIGGKTILVSLDTQALQAERDQANAGLQSAMAESATARADGDADRERAAQLRADQAQAQVALLDYRISEAEIIAPTSGILMGEDLRRREGASLNRGDSLFEIATPGAYRAEILVPDHDIDKITTGARVSLHLDAYSLSRFTGKIERIYPLTETVHGKNVFRVIAALETDTKKLQPGMGGDARVRAGWQPLGWSVLEPLVDRIRGFIWL